MISRFIGNPDDQLFATYHPPDAERGRDRAVLLCYPAQQEYRHSHWAFRKLAMQLASQGFHAMRFDYSGTGDSAGDMPETGLERWTADIATAAAELRELSGLRKIALVGFRIGASLAVHATAKGLSIADLVLWEPVVEGRAYLSQLTEAQDRFVTALRYPQDMSRSPDELLGFPLPPAVRAQIAAINLAAGPFGKPGRVLVLDAEQRADSERLVKAMTAQGIAVFHERVDDTGMTSAYATQAETLLAHKILDAIVSFLATTA
ncbi:MAG TPA: alpha/beta hydrolase [Gemmatimonadaceae bacterium]|jgi:pimeloyl-ACP methyl ester carboxylesterase